MGWWFGGQNISAFNTTELGKVHKETHCNHQCPPKFCIFNYIVVVEVVVVAVVVVVVVVVVVAAAGVFVVVVVSYVGLC